MRALIIISTLMLLSSLPLAVLSDNSQFEQIRREHRQRTELLMKETLKPFSGEGHHPSKRALQFALATLWLNERTDEGNERLRQAFREIIGSEEDNPSGKMTPDRAYGQKWGNMRLWLRIFYLFNSESKHHPGRLAADVEDRMRDFFWNFAQMRMPPLRRTDPDCIWLIMNSENHDMMDYGNSFLALQAIRNHPSYHNRKLADGHTVAEYVAAWTEHYKRYCDTRANSGLYVEVSPQYGKWFLPEVINIYEFADDPVLRKKMELLLHLTWADWAVDQLRGFRGGGLTRVYPNHYSYMGGSDSWSDMARIFLDKNGAWERNHYMNTLHPYYYILGTTGYEMPDLVMALALDDEARGDYEYVTLRPAKLADRPAWAETKVPEYAEKYTSIWDTPLAYWMDGKDPRAIRYSYHTPDYILGSWFEDPDAEYAAIHSQNRWQGIIFSTGPDARVYPECVALRPRVTMRQHQAIQHQNVLLVQKNRKALHSGDMRIRFASGMKSRLMEQDGWLFLEEGDAYLGVRPHAGKDDSYEWVDGNYILCKDEFAPVVFVAGRKSDHPTLEDFIAYTGSIRFAKSRDHLICSFTDATGNPVSIGLDIGEEVRRATINGRPVNLRPNRVFDSPHLISERGSGKVTVQKGDWKLELDFRNAEMRELGRPAGL